MVVISIIIILISVAVVSYRTSVLHAKESVLRQDLNAMRNAIDAYTYDKRKAPQALDDLVSGDYLKEIPKDPFTGQPNWEPHQEDNPTDPNQIGIDGVHSASEAVSSEGTPYSSW